MTNYAWANPETHVREQAPTLEEARHRLWTELQKYNKTGYARIEHACIYRQERIGTVSQTSSKLEISEPWEDCAWTDPETGHRLTQDSIEQAVRQIQMDWPLSDAPEQVILYRQCLASVVVKDKPEPPVPTPAPVIVECTPASLIQQIQEGTGDLATASALALLWIAQALREIADTIGVEPQQESLTIETPQEWHKRAFAESDEDRRARMVRERKNK